MQHFYFFWLNVAFWTFVCNAWTIDYKSKKSLFMGRAFHHFKEYDHVIYLLHILLAMNVIRNILRYVKWKFKIFSSKEITEKYYVNTSENYENDLLFKKTRWYCYLIESQLNGCIM